MRYGRRGGRGRAFRCRRRRHARGCQTVKGQGLEKTASGFPSSRVDAEAQFSFEIGADDIDGPLGVVAVYEQVGADSFVVGETQAVLGLVDDGDRLEAGEFGELNGEVC